MKVNRLLIIDDEPEIADVIREVAQGLDFEVTATDNPVDFWHHFDSAEPGMIILDLKMPGVDGVELLRALAERKTAARIGVMSGTDQRVLQSALRLGKSRGLHMIGSLQKPMQVRDIRELLGTVSARLKPLGESDLRQAIDERQIIAYFQPKISLSADDHASLSACEALARWNHPERGLLGPDKFIPLAEKTQLIGPLTDLILRQTVDQLASWQEQGLVLSAAVNLAPQLLGDIDLPDRYVDLCQSRALEPDRLTLEITESGAMDDVALTMDILTRLRLKGFGLSLDDFGTGYSSLVQLHRMPFNEMKIDKSFVGESDLNAEAVKIIRSIASLSHSLDLSLCAEGVESKNALQLVRDVGCHSAQGFLVSKPLPAAKLFEFVQLSDGRFVARSPAPNENSGPKLS